MRRIKCAVPFQHPINRCARRHLTDGRRRPRIGALLERQADRIRAVFTQHTLLAQIPARAQNALLDTRSGAIPGAAGLAVGKRNPIEAITTCLLDPAGHSTHAYAERFGDLVQALPGPNCLDHLAAMFLERAFLTMAQHSKILSPYISSLSKQAVSISCVGGASAPKSGRRFFWDRRFQSPFGRLSAPIPKTSLSTKPKAPYINAELPNNSP